MLELYALGEKLIDTSAYISQFLDIELTLPYVTWLPGQLVPELEVVFFTFSVFEWLFGFGLLVILILKLFKFVMSIVPFL